MQRALRRAEWVVGVVWVVSWFEYYLEVYRHRHAAPPPWIGLPAPQLAVPQGAHAGGWLLMVLACSALAPSAFVALRAWRWSRARSSSAAEPRFPIGWTVGVFGVVLCAAGAVNQAIHRPPLTVDLTLRTGNGGFVVLGAALAAAGLALGFARRGARRASRST